MSKILLPIIILFGIACSKPTIEAPAPEKDVHPCTDFDECDWTIYVNDNEVPSLGLSQCERCLEWDADLQIIYQPALGRIFFRSGVEICEENFEWLFIGIENSMPQCSIPPYEFHVYPTYEPSTGRFWEAELTFEPYECLAESVPTCLAFRWLIDCPYN